MGSTDGAMPNSKATTPHPFSPCSIGSAHGVLGLAAAAPWHRSGCSAQPIVCPQPVPSKVEGRGRIRGRGRALRTCLQGSALSIGSGGAKGRRPATPWSSSSWANGRKGPSAGRRPPTPCSPPPGGKRSPVPSTRTKAVEPSRAWAMATWEKTSPSMEDWVVRVVLPRSTSCCMLPSTRPRIGPSLSTSRSPSPPLSVNQPVVCVNQAVTSRPFSAPNRGQRAEYWDR